MSISMNKKLPGIPQNPGERTVHTLSRILHLVPFFLSNNSLSQHCLGYFYKTGNIGTVHIVA